MSPAVDAHVLDDELVLYDSRTDRAYALNATATLLWELYSQPLTVDEATGRVAERYGREEAEVARDVEEFVTMARAAGLLLPDETESPERVA